MVTELLQKLLENDVLTEDTKSSIKATFETVIQEAKEQARSEVTEELTARFAEDFVKERDTLVESIDEMINKAIEEYSQQVGNSLNEHIEAHKTDIEAFRDLELEHATRLVETREELVQSTKTDIKTLVEKLDAFLDTVVDAEFAEIREDLLESQRTALGAKIFEGFRDEFEQYYARTTGVADQLAKLSAQAKAAEEENENLKESLNNITRTQTLTTVLTPLTGKSRSVMETILATVATDKLQETYDRFIDRVIKEGVQERTPQAGTQSEKEPKEVLAESKVDPKSVKLRTGDTVAKKAVVTEGVGLTESDKKRLLQSAGLL